MILHSLNRYYERLLTEGRIQPPGLQEKEIPFVVELDAGGRFVALRRTGDGKRGKRFTVPYEVKKAANIAANLLWDNPEYVLGIPRTTATEKQAAKVPARHAAFLKRLDDLPEAVKADPGVAAVLSFLEVGDFETLKAAEGFSDLIEAGANVSFKLADEGTLVCERPAVRAAVAAGAADTPEPGASTWCLVTGRRAAPALTHPSVKGVRGAQSSGANIVSFNRDAFKSHGWEQGENAPVGEGAAAAYVAALNHLLDRENRTHHLVEGDTTFVFWAAKKNVLETKFAHLLGGFGEDQEAESDGTPVKSALDAVRTGLLQSLENDDTPFYVLGLAPNAARLAVRFWHVGTVGEVAKKIRKHFDDLDVDGLSEMRHPPGLWALLGAASAGRDPKKLSDTLRGRLAADLTAAVLEETPYPATLLARTVARCRAEQGVVPIRAALVKASLKRTTSKEVTVSLDPDNDNPGYLLGRLFAALEDVQRGAQGGNINVTIRDRYFGAAVAAPLSVFVQLDKLKNAHLKKLKRINPGHAVNAEKLIAAITDRMAGDRSFPASLKLEDQGFFILGYHHQRNDFFAKSNAAKEA